MMSDCQKKLLHILDVDFMHMCFRLKLYVLSLATPAEEVRIHISEEHSLTMLSKRVCSNNAELSSDLRGSDKAYQGLLSGLASLRQKISNMELIQSAAHLDCSARNKSCSRLTIIKQSLLPETTINIMAQAKTYGDDIIFSIKPMPNRIQNGSKPNTWEANII